MASSAPLAKTFLIARGLSVVAMVAIVGMTAHFVSQLVDSNIDPPREIVGTLSVVSHKCLPPRMNTLAQANQSPTTDLSSSPLHPALSPTLLQLRLDHPPHPHGSRLPPSPRFHHHLRPPGPPHQPPQLPFNPQRIGCQLCRVGVGLCHGSRVWERGQCCDGTYRVGRQWKSRMLPDQSCLGSGCGVVCAVRNQYNRIAGHVVEGQEGRAYQERGLKACMLSSSSDGGSDC